MDRNLLFKLGRFLLVVIGFFLSLSSASFGQTINYTSGTLSTSIKVINSCTVAPSNGAMQFTVISSEGGAPVSLLVLGPVNLFPPATILPGNTYTFNPSQTLPAGTYNWLLGDGTNTIGSVTDNVTYPPLVISNLAAAPLGITKDIEANNTSCVAQNGQVQATITGGSQSIGTGSYNYTWSSTNGTGPISGTTDGSTPLNLATLLGVAGLRGGTYDIQVSDNLSSCTTSASFTITDPSPALFTITTLPPLTICAGDNITLTMNNSELGVTYEILRNVVALPTPITFTGTATGPFVMTFPSTQFASGNNIAVRATNGFCTPVLMTNTFNLTINPLPTLSGISIPNICQGTTSVNLTYTSTTGSPNLYSIDYDLAAETQGFVDVVNAALTASPVALVTPAAALPGIYNGTLTVRNGASGCPALPIPISITIVANPTITLSANPSICIGTLTANLGYTATTGSPNQYSINFDLAAEAQGFVDVPVTALPASPIVITIPPAALVGPYNGTITVINGGSGCISTAQAFSVTINPTPSVALDPIPAICAGTTSVNLGYTGATGGPNQYIIDYNLAAETAGFVDVPATGLPASPIVLTIPGAAAAATYSGTVRVLNSLTGCPGPAMPISITINPSPTITVTNLNPAICLGTLSTSLVYTATTGTPDQYSIDYDLIAQGQGFVDVVNAALPGSPISIPVPAGALAGIYNGTLTVRNNTTGCNSTSQAITITISPNPTLTLGANPSICIGSATASLPFTATTGSPNQYSIDFDLAAQTAGFVDVPNTALGASPINIVVPGTATATTYNATITVLNTTTGCPSSAQPFTITINPTPTITLGANPSVCVGTLATSITYSAITGTPDRYSIDYNLAAEAQGFTDVVDAPLAASPIPLPIPVTAVAGLYNATLTVKNSTSTCPSIAQAISITLQASPTGTISGGSTVCSGSATSIQVSFTGTGPWTFRINDGTTTSPPIPSFFNTLNIPIVASSTTTYTLVSVADATACPGIVTGTGMTTITVNLAPQINLAVGSTINPLCSGGVSAVTVTNSQVGVSYQLRNDADNSTIGAPVIGDGTTISLPTGPLLTNTTFNVLATSTGCPPVELTNTTTITVSGTINAGLAVSPVDNTVCTGSSTIIQVAASENGVLYQLRDDADDSLIGAAVPGTGATIDLPTGPLNINTTFNVLASNGSCSIELTDSETVTVGPSPNAGLTVSITLDPVCSGGVSGIVVELSQVGVSYQLRDDADDSPIGAPVVGTGSDITISTGVLTADKTFNILATGPGCAPVVLTTVPTVFVSGTINAALLLNAAASTICEGTATDIQIATSESGVSYQLRDNATNTPIGAPVVGNGGTILLTTLNLSATTTFNVLAFNATCSIQLTDTETVNVDVAPNPALLVNATPNPLCIGGISNVTVDLSQTGVSYQLRRDSDDSPIGAPVIGTGATINLPTGVLNADTDFNVLATSGVCTAVELSTVVTVTVAGTIDASLTVSSSASAICAGTSTFVQVQLSVVGVNYQLRDDATDAVIGSPVAGTGVTINLPTGNLTATTVFNVIANNGTCSIELTDKETITVNPAPTLGLGVTAAPSLICTGTSTNIVVANSENGINYQLRNNAGNVLVGVPVAGTGGNISLPSGNLSATTTFNVLAIAGTCSAQLTSTVTVAIRLPGDPACGGSGPSDCTNFSSIQPTIITQPSCNDRDAGQVSFTISRADGTPTTFRVIWTINGSSQTKFTTATVAFNDLSSGLYQYTIIDEGNGKSCGPVDFFLDLKTQVEILSKDVSANVTCFGGTDGNAILSVDGSTTGEYWYKYVLDGTESSAQTFTPGAPLPGGLPADDDDFIIIKVDDNFAFTCPDTVMVRIKHTYAKIDFGVAATDVTTCNGTDGGIQITTIVGGDSGTQPLQIRLKKAVPFSTDPSGYIVAFDYTDVAAGTKTYTALSQGNYIVDVRDHLDCVQSKPIAIQAPGQVPLSSVGIVAADASCTNGGESGTIKVTISDPGIYKVAVSQDQVNVPPDADFVDYNAPSLPSITFNNLASGVYFLYLKSSTTTCPTRTDAITINGVKALADFEVLSNCGNVNLTLNNITGQQDAPFVVRVYSNDDKFFKIDSLSSPGIPLSNAVSFTYAASQHTFLVNPGTYRFVMVQTQTTGSGSCTLVSDTVVYDVRELLGIVLGEVKPSFPEPKHTGSIEISNITGGTRFVSDANELYYEISLTTADDDITIFDWTILKLDPQNKFLKLYEFLPPGVYRVKVRDAAGCIKTLDVELPLDPSVYVPNIFTPNDDNINDEFEVLNLPLTGGHKLIITNRWGNEVFKSNDYRDGNFWRAEDASDGVYFYRLKVEGGETYTGWVEIIRGSKP